MTDIEQLEKEIQKEFKICEDGFKFVRTNIEGRGVITERTVPSANDTKRLRAALLSARRELTEVKAQRDLYKQCLDDLRGAIDKRLKGLTQ